MRSRGSQHGRELFLASGTETFLTRGGIRTKGGMGGVFDIISTSRLRAAVRMVTGLARELSRLCRGKSGG